MGNATLERKLEGVDGHTRFCFEQDYAVRLSLNYIYRGGKFMLVNKKHIGKTQFI